MNALRYFAICAQAAGRIPLFGGRFHQVSVFFAR